jgi:cobalt-zinc-cadmium efflux system outer membrane protein
MKSFLIIVIAVLFLISPRWVPAETPTVTLDELLAEVIKNNPEIQAAESRSVAAEAKSPQARALPDPVLSFVTRNNDGNPVPFTELGNDPISSIGFMWEEAFPFPGKLALAGEVAQKEADAAKADIQTVRWRITGDLKQTFYEYFHADKSIQILNSSLELLRHFEEIARERYRVGEGIQQDVLRAQVEISILQQRITSIEQEKATAAAKINQLLNRPVDAPLADPAEITETKVSIPENVLDASLISRSPRIQSQEAIAASQQSGLDLAKKQFRPDFVSSVEYANSPDFPDMWKIQIGLRLPLFYKSKQQNGVVEATQNLTSAQRELQAIRQEVAFNIRNQYLQMQASDKLLKLYDQAVLPQTNLALESSLASYQVGKSDFLTTLNNFITLLEYRMNYYAELAKHESAIARLEQAIGQSITQLAPVSGGNNHE